LRQKRDEGGGKWSRNVFNSTVNLLVKLLSVKKSGRAELECTLGKQ